METEILLTVYLNGSAQSKGAKLFSRHLSVSSSCHFDYNKVIDVMKMLFGNSCVVVFQVI